MNRCMLVLATLLLCPAMPVLALTPLPTPELKGLEPETITTIETARTRVRQLEAQQAPDSQRAAAWGELGMFYHAHRQLDAALPCYANASELDPESVRWPYYQGLIHAVRGDTARAIAAFRQALEPEPDHAPTRLRLARLLLAQGDIETATRHFRALIDHPGFRAAALAGLGEAALRSGRYREAVERLQAALEQDPQATALHYPLGQALRTLGDHHRAREHFARYSDTEPAFPDPLRADLDDYVSGEGARLRRAMQAIRERDFRTAAAELGAVLEKQPGNVNLRVSLARSLYLTGERQQAEEHLAAALQREPDHPLANYLLGVLRLAEGRLQDALHHFKRTLAREPEHAGAHHHLGDVLFLSGDYTAAETHYGRASALVPADATARYMRIIAAWQAGEHWAALRSHIDAARRRFPEQPLFQYLAARLLAAAPDGGVRNGRAAVNLAKGLEGRIPPPEYAATLAMAYAAAGDFERAQALQQQAIDAAADWGRFDVAARMQMALENYRQGRASRQPFNLAEPIFQPPPVDVVQVFRDYPSDAPY